MGCLNCNRDTVGKAVFCDACLQEMESFPIPQGTPVIIHAQPTPVTQKAQNAQHFSSIEEQLIASRRASRRLAVALGFALFLLLLTAGALAYLLCFGIPESFKDIRAPW